MIGRTLKHYTIESQLGKGGMGTVYRARDTRLHRMIALKVLDSQFTTDADRKGRFLQEARTAAAITHPAIAQVYDVDEAEGITFIAMELVEGKTVRQLITDKDLDLMAALEIAIHAADGLARAHETGIVHRDIKSENIMVTKDGHTKILDFGLAKLNPLHNVQSSGSQEEHISQMATMAQTQAGMVVGTVAYMSPEQARGRAIDHRSDLFSLGITIYEMATGQLPFRGDSPLDTMHAIAFEETQPITVIRQNMPPELQRIINRCLRKRPEDRYSDARALMTDLKALKRDLESGVTRAVPLEDRVLEGIALLKNSQPSTKIWIAGIAAVTILILIALAVTKHLSFWPAAGIAVVAWFIYRRFKFQDQRLMRRFSSKISKLPDVKLVVFKEKQATVVVDRIQAKIYLRANSLMESVNRKLLFTKPITFVLRDDVSLEEFRRILQEPGVLYLRDDALDG